ADVHPPHATDDDEGETDRRDHRQTFGDLTETIGDLGEIAVQRAAQQLSIGIQRIVYAQHVVVDVAKIDLRLHGQEGTRTVGENAEHLSLRREMTAQLEYHAFD